MKLKKFLKWFIIIESEKRRENQMSFSSHERRYEGGLNFSYPNSPKIVHVDRYRYCGKYTCYEQYECDDMLGNRWSLVTHAGRIIALAYESKDGTTEVYPFYEANRWENQFVRTISADRFRMAGQFGRGSTVIRVSWCDVHKDVVLNNRVDLWSEVHLMVYLLTHGDFHLNRHLIEFEMYTSRKYETAIEMFEKIPRQIKMF